ncbi:MAG: GDP-mannose 4,6-dehydratase, partial [Candidatus Diapherotrites archaeon]
DNCKATELVLRKGKNGEAYNVGGRDEMTNLELTKTILEDFGMGEEMIEFVQDRKGHDRRYAIDDSKISALGFEPQKTFKEGLKETIQWYKENEKWWKPLLKHQLEVKK